MAVTKIIGPIGGADYATPALWFASFASVLLDDQIGNVQYESDGSAEVVVTAAQVLSGVTAGIFTVTLKCDTGDSFADHADKLTNALRYDATKGAAIRKSSGVDSLFEITCSNFILDRLQFKKDSTYQFVVDYQDTAFTGRIINQCILCHASTIGFVANICGETTVTNSLFINLDNSTGIRNSIANNIVQDCTIVCLGTGSGVTGFSAPYGAPLLKNVVVAGYATDYSGVAGTCANNATDLSSFGGTNYGTSGQTSVVKATEWENTTAGTEDFRVKSGSAKLKNNGTPTGTPSTDIVGQTRSGSTPTIGVWELLASGGNTTISPDKDDLVLSFSVPDRLVNTYLFPDADVTDGGWLNEVDSNTNLFASIDEATISDSDYIKSSINPSSDLCEIGLSNPTSTPAEPFVVSYRYQKSGGTGQIDLVVSLVETSTIIKTWTHTNISSSFVTQNQTLSSGEFASISNFNNLRIRFTANKV